MKESTAWVVIAMRMDRQVVFREGYGICSQIYSFPFTSLPFTAYARLDRRLQLFCPEYSDDAGYWWERTREGNQCRVLACLLLAEMAREEERDEKREDH